MAYFLHQAASILRCAGRTSMAPAAPSGAAPASAGPVDPARIEDLVARQTASSPTQGALDRLRARQRPPPRRTRRATLLSRPSRPSS